MNCVIDVDGDFNDKSSESVEKLTDNVTTVMIAEMQPPFENDDCVDENAQSFSESIINAQREAETAAELIENQEPEPEPDLPEVPKLLRLPQSDIIQKTNEFQQNNQQLDILLLKAESYSHFLQAGLDRCQPWDEAAAPASASNTPSSHKKRKSSAADLSPVESLSKRGIGESGNLAGDVSANNISAAIRQPASLVGGTLLPYQLEGLQWLSRLYENGLSGILADEMGLGKTIQVIAFIARLREKNANGPFLIAAPLATIPNWINEFKKWLPSCPVVMYHGSAAERAAIVKSKMKKVDQKSPLFPVVVTSFEICMVDKAVLEHYYWQYIILDEGHRIKNRNCRLVRELKSIKSVSRLLLSGTPIQNTLEELWSLLNYCSPQIFDDLSVFQSWFGFRNIGKDTQVDDIISTEQRERVVSKLHDILRPFLLRRMKKDVLIDMPPKQEIVVYCGMSSMQREYYSHVQNDSIRDALVAVGIEKAQDISQINKLMNLRKVCNHPFLFGEPKDDAGEYLGQADPRILSIASGKFKLLGRMLPLLKKNGHKVLIFSQMTELLDILEDFIIHFGYQYCRLDGSTKVEDRQAGIDLFNRDPNVFVYLLSTRAGGLGINLAAADTCILFDSDWNPHQDSQAQDRCHRIGQQKPVVVYRFLTVGSVEIEMMEKQISKKKLERLAIVGGGFNSAAAPSKRLTLARLRNLLEDDVKNLSRMSKLDSAASADAELASPTGPRRKSTSSHATANQAPAQGQGRLNEICDVELKLIMDRKKIFRTFFEAKAEVDNVVVSDEVPVEGRMYDVVKASGDHVGLLQGVH